MGRIQDFPLMVLVLAFVTQTIAAYLGDMLSKRARLREGAERADFGTILPATLTLLGLIIGFSFSMAVSRYDQRKTLEAAEANAIGTEYARAALLPAGRTALTRELLVEYLEQRLLFYQVQSQERLEQIDTETIALENKLWSGVAGFATTQPTPMATLVTAGMNDVLNSRGYTQAAWLNRIPTEAWLLLILVAIACNLLLGYSEWHAVRSTLLIFPLLVAIAFFLIADIDSPRHGVIRVAPQNLIVLYQTMKGS